MLLIKEANFVCSSPYLKKCPPPTLPEFAFIGRSNVGKSSLINMLVGKKDLAKTSSTPGKTQLINHFIINNEWFIVDLPGYGYAKTSKKNRDKWPEMIANFLEKRDTLISTFVLIDSRIEPQKIDVEFIEWLGENGIPFVIVFTKIDKINQRELTANVNLYKKHLLENWEELPEMIFSSAKTERGKEDILNYIQKNYKL